MAVGILFLLVMYVTMVDGPIAAAPVEMFPTNIRYTSMSRPYHIGNGWLGSHSLRHGRGHGQYLLVEALRWRDRGRRRPPISPNTPPLVTVVVAFLFIKDRKDMDLQD